MTQRANIMKVAPEAIAPLFEAGKYLQQQSGLEPTLLTLVNLRASQINGCAFCLAMHNREAQEQGKMGDWVWGLPAWRECPWYTDRERAALEWTEALTLVAGNDVPDDVYERVRAQFDERELAALTLAVATINSWNRLAIAFRADPTKAEAVLASLHTPAMAH